AAGRRAGRTAARRSRDRRQPGASRERDCLLRGSRGFRGAAQDRRPLARRAPPVVLKVLEVQRVLGVLVLRVPRVPEVPPDEVRGSALSPPVAPVAPPAP